MDATSLSNQIPALVAPKPLLSNTTTGDYTIIKPQLNPSTSTLPATVAVSNSSSDHQCKSVVKAAFVVQSKHVSMLTDVRKPSFKTHRKAATGYAAALLDAVCCDLTNTRARNILLPWIEKDARKVKMIAREVLEDESIKEEKKGYMVRKVVERGNVYAKLVVVVRMLVAKGKVKAVEEVMDEFIQLWTELCGIERVVLVKKRKLHSLYDQ